MSKARVIYHNLNDDCSSTEMGGVSFVHNVPVEVDLDDATSDALVDAALQNRFFEVQGVPAHDALMEMRKKRGSRPAKTEIERHKKIEPALAERDKKIAEAEAAKAKADEAAHKAVADAHKGVEDAKQKAEVAPVHPAS